MKKHAVGIVCRNRANLTNQTLMGLLYSDQPKGDYDLFLIDNGSDDQTREELKSFVAGGLLPVKNLYSFATETSIPHAWNLFLALTQKYEYRTKLDNDMVMLRTVTPSSKPKRHGGVPEEHPDSVDPLGGAPRSGAIIGGVNSLTSRIQRPAGSIYATNDDTSRFNQAHSKFLDHMEYFGTENAIDLMAFVPVPPQQIFQEASNAAHNNQVNGRSFLAGGCIMINKRAFDSLGYFDENIPRRIDVEYSQRAIKNGLNLGYHPHYWAVHIGVGMDTEDTAAKQIKTEQANAMLNHDLPAGRRPSKWENTVYKVISASKNNKIVNLK